MKAVVFEQFGGPEVLRYADLPMPEPARGQVLVKMISAGVCKADWRVRTGRCQWLTCPFPVTLGYEMAGRVEALGPGVTGFAIGQPVHVLHMACYGTYTEYMAVTADDVVEMPEGIDFDAAAAAFNYFVAWGLLNQIVEAKEGQTLYIGGAAGGVGTAVIQLAQLQEHARRSQRQHRREVRLPTGTGGRRRLQLQDRETTSRRSSASPAAGAWTTSTTRWPARSSAASSTCWPPTGRSSSTTTWAAIPRTRRSSTSCRAAARCCYGIRYFSIHVHDTDPEGFKKVKRQVLGAHGRRRAQASHLQGPTALRGGRAHQMIESGEVLGKLVLHLRFGQHGVHDTLVVEGSTKHGRPRSPTPEEASPATGGV